MSTALADSFHKTLGMLNQLSIVCTVRISSLISREMRDQQDYSVRERITINRDEQKL